MHIHAYAQCIHMVPDAIWLIWTHSCGTNRYVRQFSSLLRCSDSFWCIFSDLCGCFYAGFSKHLLDFLGHSCCLHTNTDGKQPSDVDDTISNGDNDLNWVAAAQLAAEIQSMHNKAIQQQNNLPVLPEPPTNPQSPCHGVPKPSHWHVKCTIEPRNLSQTWKVEITYLGHRITMQSMWWPGNRNGQLKNIVAESRGQGECWWEVEDYGRRINMKWSTKIKVTWCNLPNADWSPGNLKLRGCLWVSWQGVGDRGEDIVASVQGDKAGGRDGKWIYMLGMGPGM